MFNVYIPKHGEVSDIAKLQYLGYELRCEDANVYSIFKGVFRLTKPIRFSEAEYARQAFMKFAKEELKWLQTDAGKEWLATHGTV